MFYTEKKLRLFAELEESEQRKVIEKELPYYKESFFEYDVMDYKEIWTEELENLGFNDIKIYYTGFYTGNDGLCFTGNVSGNDFILFLEKIGYKINSDLKKCLDSDIDFYLYLKHSSRYYHENSVDINLSYDEYYVSEETEKIVEKYFDEIESYIENWRYNLCCQWYSQLLMQYESYDNETSITEYLSENYLFDEELNKYDYDSTEFYETSRIETETQLNKIDLEAEKYYSRKDLPYTG